LDAAAKDVARLLLGYLVWFSACKPLAQKPEKLRNAATDFCSKSWLTDYALFCPRVSRLREKATLFHTITPVMGQSWDATVSCDIKV